MNEKNGKEDCGSGEKTKGNPLQPILISGRSIQSNANLRLRSKSDEQASPVYQRALDKEQQQPLLTRAACLIGKNYSRKINPSRREGIASAQRNSAPVCVLGSWIFCAGENLTSCAVKLPAAICATNFLTFRAPTMSARTKDASEKTVVNVEVYRKTNVDAAASFKILMSKARSFNRVAVRELN